MLGEVMASDAGRNDVKALTIEYLLELGMLEDAYITSRYVLREYMKEEVDRLMTAVKRVMERVR